MFIEKSEVINIFRAKMYYTAALMLKNMAPDSTLLKDDSTFLQALSSYGMRFRVFPFIPRIQLSAPRTCSYSLSAVYSRLYSP